MKVEREIAWFSLPFAAGVIAAAYAADVPAVTESIFASSALYAAVAFMACLIITSGKTQYAGYAPILVCLMSFTCGLFTGMTGHMMAACSPEVPGAVTARLASLGAAMGDHIDTIAFSDSGTNAVIKALLTGDRSSLSTETAESFRSSGASHILALSGLHLGIIYMIISRSLAFAGNSPAALRIRSILTILLCGTYTLATGAGDSITRAFIFILAGETAKLTGRHRSTAGIMMASLFLQLAADPTAARSVGFQLSYAAMAGIAFIFPFLKNFWHYGIQQKPPRGGLLQHIWNSAALSISCQMTAGPIAYLYFGTFPKHFLLTNLIALPLTGFIIPISILVLAASMAGVCPAWLLHAAEAAVNALSYSLRIISGM